MAELKVVEMDRWEVSRLLRSVLRDRHNIRRIMVITESREGGGRTYSNMNQVDKLWWFEAHKRLMLDPRTKFIPPEGS